MWYYEQQDMHGRWTPRSATRQPETDPRRNGGRRIRAAVEVSPMDWDLPLDELRARYGTPDAPAPMPADPATASRDA